MSVVLAPSNALRSGLNEHGLYSTAYMYADLDRLTVAAVEVLGCFSGGRSIEDAIAQLDAKRGSRTTSSGRSRRLCKKRKILREQDGKVVVDGRFGSLLIHCRDKVVVEVGCGSGVLSVFAAKAGAKKVCNRGRPGRGPCRRDLQGQWL